MWSHSSAAGYYRVYPAYRHHSRIVLGWVVSSLADLVLARREKRLHNHEIRIEMPESMLDSEAPDIVSFVASGIRKPKLRPYVMLWNETFVTYDKELKHNCM